MDSNQKRALGTALGLLAGCAIGFAIGGYQGFRIGTSSILNHALTKDAREVEARIATVRQLRTGNQEAAIETLETGLSDILIGFDPAEPYAGLDAETVAALRKAIAAARTYRAEYPRPQGDFRANMVDELFARELYR